MATAPGRPLPSAFALTALLCGVSLCVTVAFTGFAWLIEPTAERTGYAELLQTYVTVCVPIALFLGGFAFWWLVAPVDRLRHALARGVDPRDLPVADVRYAMTFCEQTGLVALTSWVVPGIGWPLVVYFFGSPAMMGRAAWLAVAAVAAGIIANRAITATGYLIMHYRIGPVILAGGTLEHLKPVRLFRAWQHILTIVVILGILQPLIVAVLIDQGVANTGILIYVGVLLLLVALVTAGNGLVTFSRTTGHLAARMEEVRGGNFDVQAEIRNLDTFGQLASDFNAMVAGLRQRERIRETFGRYISHQVAAEILAGNVTLGGERRTATVLFSDIRGFTLMSEQMTPEAVVSFLNRYLDIMVERVFANGGVLDKFIGDAIMAVWGVPIGGEDIAADARNALRCAREMSAALDALNAERTTEGLPAIEIGIGLHTGPLVAGNIGSERFMNYTVIGDTVNLTSRLEGMTKKLGKRILISEATARLVETEFEVVQLEEMPVRGRAGTVRVFGVV